MGWSADGWGKYIAFHAVQDLALCLPASHQRYNPTMITSFCVTAGHAGELIPSNEFCSPAVPWDEKENCVYLGAAFHHGLASLVLLYATHSSCRATRAFTCACKFSVCSNFAWQTHCSALLQLKLSNHLFRLEHVCTAPSILLCCDWFAKTDVHLNEVVFLLNPPAKIFLREEAHCSKLQNSEDKQFDTNEMPSTCKYFV